MTPKLAEINHLLLNESGVWNVADKINATGIRYSDGLSHEQALLSVLNKTQDLRWCSTELQAHCNNWVMQYHLSPLRSQVISALSLPESGPILEIGCGCGAISRYLGDCGYSVDAIEGSDQRAALARHRCKGLDHVQIYHANARKLNLPSRHYAAVLFIGVLEYAGAFAEQGISPEQEVVAALQQVIPALQDHGVIIIAIENRLGFKYIAGAREDHYAVANIGLYDYPAHDGALWQRYGGIKTWDLQQWTTLIDQVGGLHKRLYYPFPDYKLPQVLLADTFIKANPYCHSVLRQLQSSDRCGTWLPPVEEELYWRSMAQADCLDRFANSFCLVLGRTQDSVDQCLNFDFVQFPGLQQHIEFRHISYKPATTNTIHQLYWDPNHQPGEAAHDPAHQEPAEYSYYEGEPLIDQWRQTLDSYADPAILHRLLQQYWNYLCLQSSSSPVEGKLFDALPTNIIVDPSGQWHSLHQQWVWNAPIEPEYVYFRALLYFALSHNNHLDFLHRQGITRVADFIDLGLRIVDLDPTVQINRCCALEQQFLDQVLLPQFSQNVRKLLQQGLHDPNFPLAATCLTVYWSDAKGDFSSNRAASQEVRQTSSTMWVRFTLPDSARQARTLRIDPVDHRLSAEYSSFSLRSICYRSANRKNSSIELWPGHLTTTAELVYDTEPIQAETMFTVAGIDSQLIFDVSQLDLGDHGKLELAINMQWTTTRGQTALYQALLQGNAKLAHQLREKFAALQL